MDSVTEFDAAKFYLGKLCKRGHEWEGSGQSLRYRSGDKLCVECQKVRKHKYDKAKSEQLKEVKRKQREEKFAKIDPIILDEIDNTKFFLGKLCKYGHNYKETGYSLRYVCQKHGCVICENLVKTTYRLSKEGQQKVKQYRLENRDKIRAKNKAYYSQEHIAQKARDRAKQWVKDNPERAKANRKAWLQTDKGKFVEQQRRHNRRAAKKVPYCISLTLEQVQNIFAAFDNTCAYCGSPDRLTLDHYIPLSKGGTHTVGNTIPCCHSCNSGKKNRDSKIWYEKQSFFSQLRWKKIQKYLGKEVCNGQLTLF